MFISGSIEQVVLYIKTLMCYNIQYESSDIDYVDDEEEDEDFSSTYLERGLCIPQDRLEDIDFSAFLNDDLIRLDDQFPPNIPLLLESDRNDVVGCCNQEDEVSSHGPCESSVCEESLNSEPSQCISGDVSSCISGEQQHSNDDDDDDDIDGGKKVGLVKKKAMRRGRRRGRKIKRRCSHCQAEQTPQWRAGPMGRNSLCNACGLRFKMGLLLSTYRPAASPNFDTAKHSNFHKRLMRNRRKEIM